MRDAMRDLIIECTELVNGKQAFIDARDKLLRDYDAATPDEQRRQFVSMVTLAIGAGVKAGLQDPEVLSEASAARRTQ